ncbi:MAG: DUF6371 domain-containing protein [Desulfobacterales bacterium]
MSTFRYILEPYSGPGSRYTCPACGKQRVFVRYIDAETRKHIHPDVGRCDREEKCRYHFTPSEYFKGNGVKPEPSDHIPLHEPRKEPSYIDRSIFEKSLSGYDINNLVIFLREKFGDDLTRKAVKEYAIGTSKKWGGSAAIFWQIDSAGRIRAGKIMQYDDTGHRVKDPDGKSMISWVHAALHLDGFHLSQCLFGLHLIKEYPDKTICLVESEKTAVIASIVMPEYLWMATGGANGARWSDFDSFIVLKGRNVVLIPDLDKMEEWKEKASKLQGMANITLSKTILKAANEQQISEGWDLADFIIEESSFCMREKASGGAGQDPGSNAGTSGTATPGEVRAIGEPTPVAFDNDKPASEPVDIKAARQIWTDEECAMYFNKGRRMNFASRDEVLKAIREGTRRYQEQWRKKKTA